MNEPIEVIAVGTDGGLAWLTSAVDNWMWMMTAEKASTFKWVIVTYADGLVQTMPLSSGGVTLMIGDSMNVTLEGRPR